jgi:hypothetical protein
MLIQLLEYVFDYGWIMISSKQLLISFPTLAARPLAPWINPPDADENLRPSR